MSSLFTSFKKYPVGMTVVFLLIATTVAAITILSAPVFESSARIHIPAIKKEEKTKYSDNPPQQVTIQTAVEILRGNVLAEQVIKLIGTTELFPSLQPASQGEGDLLSHALASFQQQLTVTPIKDTRIIRVSFQHAEAKMTTQVVEKTLQLFQKEFRKFQAPLEAQQNEKLQIASKKMYQATGALSMFKASNQLLVLGEEKEKVTEQYEKVKSLLTAEQKNLKEQLNQLTTLQDQVTEEKTDKEMDAEINDLIRLKIYEQELLDKYGEKGSGDRLISSVRLQIDSLEKLLYKGDIPEQKKKKLKETADQIVLAKMSYSKQQEKTDLLERQIHQLENRLQRVTDQHGLLSELERRAGAAQKQYEDLVSQFKNKQLFDVEQIRIIERPVVPPTPIKPKKERGILLALISGLIGSLLYGGIQLLRDGNINR